MAKFTSQQVIDMGVELYEKHGFSRENIKAWLMVLVANNCAEVDVETCFDLIVG